MTTSTEKLKEQERMQIISDVSKTMSVLSNTPIKNQFNFSVFGNKNNFYTDQSGFKIRQLKAFKDRIKNETDSKDEGSTVLRSKRGGSISISRSMSVLPNHNNSSSFLPNISSSNRQTESILKQKNDFPFCPYCSHCQNKFDS